MSSCPHEHKNKNKTDWILTSSIVILTITIGAQYLHPLTGITPPYHLFHFGHIAIEILMTMWWGIAIGIVLIGVMNHVPRESFTAIMGRNNSFSGLIRAVSAGVLLDLCCHGILLIAAKLYERGTSLAQVITFLVASPWNSLSLTFVLIALIGLKWTLLYILGSIIIALCTGMILQALVRAGVFPDNPNKAENELQIGLKDAFKAIKFQDMKIIGILKTGWRDGKMIIKWLLFGTIIAAALRAYVPPEMFADWLGPTVAGLFITLLFATIIEICSEGSAPVAGEIVTNANAPGNGFTFLMAGVATDYTEIMAVKEFTGRWMIALALPLITVPQVLLIGFLMNLAATS